MSIQVDPLTPQSRVLPDPVRRARVGPASEAVPARSQSDGHRHAAITKRAACEVCGEVARVLVLEGYANGQPVLRRFCLKCAAEAAPADAGVFGERTRVRLHVLVALAGLALCAVGLFGDFLIPAAHAGFGWHQQLGVFAGALLLVVGLLLRTEVIALGGAFLLAASLGADWFGLTRGPGIGWKQQVMLAVGVLCLLAAGITRRRTAARRRRLDRAGGHDGQAKARPQEARGASGVAPAAAR
jgi:hypothetical protein